jgi:phosphatidylserine decarboxylase
MRPVGTPLRTRIAAALVDASPGWSQAAATRALGAFAKVPLPPPLRQPVIRAYASWYGVELNDVDPLQLELGFESLDRFFTRAMRPGARSIDRDEQVLIAPCDGTVREVLALDATARLPAKGEPLALAELLGDGEWAARFAGGVAVSIYLHPRDYHRVHAPGDALVEGLRWIPGRLAPVRDAALVQRPRVFATNERLVHMMQTALGPVAVVMIAAFGVGNLTCSYRPLPPPPRRPTPRAITLDPPARLRRGDELGIFHLGSTVVVVAAPGLLLARSQPLEQAPPYRVRLGQPLLRERGP